jgi:histidinol-phosphate phosphatase family protein
MAEPRYDVVIPTIGRPSLSMLVHALAAGSGPAPANVVVVDDRPGAPEPLDLHGVGPSGARVVSSGGRGPAAARNVGIAVTDSEWICFLDDDVLPPRDWRRRLAADIGALASGVAGSQGRVAVPLDRERRPTDWERNVLALEGASWITADMAYRRRVLLEVGGFDERFRRAYREDADLALRVMDAGHRLVRGARTVAHPVRATGPWTSVRLQAGNADDAVMRARHGPAWRTRANAPRGRFPRHAAITAAGALAPVAVCAGRRRLGAAALAAWTVGTTELWWSRTAPGPRTLGEVATMLATSVAIPPAAVAHRIAGHARLAAARARVGRRRPPAAVLLDRDGTLVRDVPYNGDPDRVQILPGAREALDRLRAAGVPIAVVSNQSGVGRGFITPDDVARVNRRVEQLLGPMGPWVMCFHAPNDGCACRKPAGGLVREAAERLGVCPSACVVVGDTGGDVAAAAAAGARAILVPNAATRPEEIAAAPRVASGLRQAVSVALGEAR